jgi:prepilin-type N-terminal cleavage/methylation domain-containing protein
VSFNITKGLPEKQRKTMKQLIMKARSGVTLVELLVVILIVTILSVSLLPLLKPFVVEAQYAAEAIPVIGDLRTRIGIYQYEKGILPTIASASANAVSKAIETWAYSKDGKTAVNEVTDLFAPGYKQLNTDSVAGAFTPYPDGSQLSKENFGRLINIDNQELVGKRCRPVHFQYAVVTNGSTYCYAIGCFGDGVNNGLPPGTGYAVCEINVRDAATSKVYKQIGTWKRYKATTEGQMSFGEVTQGTTDPEAKNTSTFCPIPAISLLKATDAKLDAVEAMRDYGWEF